MKWRRSSQKGFTLLELLVATAIFLVICAAMFGLLQVSQQKYASETQLSGSFQEARLGLDQIVRDINMSGYPASSMFSNTSNPLSYAVAPFAWDPGYLTNTDCQIGSCFPTPSDHDLIVETDLGNGNGVSWIRYQLVGSILLRGVVSPKTTGDPVSAFSGSGVMTPLVNNVVNNASQPIFVYTCYTPPPNGPQPCSSLSTNSPYNTPRYIGDVDITLIVKTPQQDLQTGALKLIELTGRGHRTNSAN